MQEANSPQSIVTAPMLRILRLLLTGMGVLLTLAWMLQRSYWFQKRLLHHRTQKELTSLLETAPNNTVAQLYLEVRRYEAEEIEEARLCFEKVTAQNPKWDWGHYNLGMTLFRLERFAEAQRHFELALRETPNLSHATFMLGYSLVQQGKFGEGFEQMRVAMLQNPIDLTFQWSYGYNLLRVNQWQEAIPVLRRLVPYREADAELQAALGEALMLQSEPKEAQKHLTRALLLKPNAPSTQALRSACDKIGRAHV